MPNSVFLTGATGVVGGSILAALSRRGDDVKALVRTAAGADAVTAQGATPVHGDVTVVDGLADAMWGASTVFHAAGVNEGCPKDAALMDEVNIDGAVNVVEAAARAGVGKLVLTSSVAAIGEAEGMVGSEHTRHGGTYVSRYARSKHLGEVAAVEAADRTGIDLVVVNPASVQGPGRAGGSADLIRRVVLSERPWLIDVAVSIVDIDDCAQGHLLAAENGVPGERYILSGATMTVAEIIATINEVAGTTIAPRWISPSVARSFGLPLSRLVPSASICPDLVRSLLHGHRYDNRRSVDELGIRYTPIEETLGRTIQWFRDTGLI